MIRMHELRPISLVPDYDSEIRALQSLAKQLPRTDMNDDMICS